MANTDTNTTAFGALVASGEPILIDGGFATQCEAMGCNIDGELWSARLLRDDPEAVVRVHRAYLDAGARIIATASYQASRDGFVAGGLTEAEADELIRTSVSLAARARDEFLIDNPGAPRPLLAASMGPYGAILHDGSEYTGDYSVSADSLRQFHGERIGVFANSAADLLVFETIPDRSEAAVLSDLLSEQAMPAWVSFSCRDADKLADGSSLVGQHLARHCNATAMRTGCNSLDRGGCTTCRRLLPDRARADQRDGDGAGIETIE